VERPQHQSGKILECPGIAAVPLGLLSWQRQQRKRQHAQRFAMVTKWLKLWGLHGALLTIKRVKIFDYEQWPPEEPNVDDSVGYTGVKIAADLVPIFLPFIYLGRAEMGFDAFVFFGMTLLAIKFNWEKRRHR
jgi:hypothetical protein